MKKGCISKDMKVSEAKRGREEGAVTIGGIMKFYMEDAVTVWSTNISIQNFSMFIKRDVKAERKSYE